MHFNTKKCYILSIKSSRTHFYSLNNTILKQVPHTAYLGIQLSENLSWNTHIATISKRANSTLGFLRRNLRNCPQSSRLTAYLALVRSTLEYGASVWDPYTQTEIDRLEKVQRSAARFVTGNYRTREPGCVTAMLKELQLPSLQDRRKSIRLALFYKVVEGLVPALPSENFLKQIRTNKRPVRTKKLC